MGHCSGPSAMAGFSLLEVPPE
ncbi:hypothetical protein C2846_13795 [Pseudomonas jilinensis]|uniref:LRRCT domain-containing protein n=1 Tax=Pseudomonas jilinensis TaxID=2078689 RepID=A0A396SAH5_9PSED|nr:hypothetical protein C2846_13795 [Pseudomonas jilinensis]